MTDLNGTIGKLSPSEPIWVHVAQRARDPRDQLPFLPSYQKSTAAVRKRYQNDTNTAMPKVIPTWYLITRYQSGIKVYQSGINVVPSVTNIIEVYQSDTNMVP